jgi:hypothetical protein
MRSVGKIGLKVDEAPTFGMPFACRPNGEVDQRPDKQEKIVTPSNTRANAAGIFDDDTKFG